VNKKKRARRPTPQQMLQRLAKRKAATTAQDTLREIRGAGDSPRAKPARTGRRKPDQSDELMAIVEYLTHAIALIRTAARGLREQYTMLDEVVVLDMAVTMLRRVDTSINHVAEGRSSEIRPEEIDNDMGERAHG
jgi:hypothetical protein